MNKLALTLIGIFCFSIVAISQNSTHQKNTKMASRHVIDPYNPEYEKGEVIVKLKDDVSAVRMKSTSGIVQIGISGLDKILMENGATEMKKVFPNAIRLKSAKVITIQGQQKEAPQLHNIYKIAFQDTSNIEKIVDEFKAEQQVDFAEPNYIFYSMEVDAPEETYAAPNDPMYGDQWHLQAINAEGAWQKEPTGGAGQVIGILDTGVDWEHPDLDDNIWINEAELNGVEGVDDDGNGFVDDIRGWDWINNDNNPMDDNSHGTHVAGIAAAEQNNSIGVSGVAFGAKIMALKVMQSSGRGNSSDIAAAVTYAANNGCTVINMSIGSYGESLMMKYAIENAYSVAVPVAAAGNDGYKIDPPYPPLPKYMPMYPACYSFVLGCQATGSDGGLASFSNFDPSGPIYPANRFNHNYELRSPGAGIISLMPNGAYKSLNGTSMASPVSAGVVALMNSYDESQSHEVIFAKLIQSSGSQIDANEAVDFELEPNLCYVDFVLLDTCSNCDEDGAPDAGETIDIYFKVKNAGGVVDSVWVSLGFAEYEDENVATILDSLSVLGTISTYGTLAGKQDHIRLKINSDIAHNRDIVLKYTISAKDYNKTVSGNILLTAQNGVEVGGFYTENLYLEAGRQYYGTQSIVIDADDTLFIEPGVELLMDDDKGINVKGTIVANGKADSTISITASNANWNSIIINKGVLNYTIIEKMNGNYLTVNSNVVFNDCIFRYNITGHSWGLLGGNFKGTLNKSSVLDNNTKYMTMYANWSNNYNNVIVANNYSEKRYSALVASNGYSNLESSVVVNNHPYNMQGYVNNTGIQYFHKANYYGYEKKASIEETYYDFFDNSSLGILSIANHSSKPSEDCHGVVWKVLVNDNYINKLDNPYSSETGLGIIGAETIKVDVFFNRAMDISIDPFVSFGVREPFTQNVVSDEVSWSADSLIWTGYYTVGIETGDGIQRVRVVGAQDMDHFEIPKEDQRFQFVIQAAGAASLQFQATPGIGKVDLEWPGSKTDDVLGYNLYRVYELTDSTISDTTLINTSLITDTTYLDAAVIPDTTYHYLYKTVGTDMAETDYSKAVIATPFSAANGDANGDQNVDIADITTIVDYLLGNNPTPFLHDAADVNYDDAINVLDIVAVINVISDSELSGVKMKSSSENKATITLENDIVYVESNTDLGGVQFTLADVKEEQHIEVLEALDGFEVIRHQKNGKMLILAYSMSGNKISNGKTPILKLNNENTWILKGILANTDGSTVPSEVVGKSTKDESIKLSNQFQLKQNYPNPLSTHTTIPYALAEASDRVIISVFDMTGRMIKHWSIDNVSPREYTLQWNSDGKSGVYVYKMQIIKNDVISLEQSKRMIVW